MEKLAVIIPVYNEEEIIEKVLEDWSFHLNKLKIDYKIFIFNNASEDNTLSVIEKVSKNNPNIIIINKKNEGHGSSILKGYKENAKSFDWLFQVDSDNEMGAENFICLWENRADYDFLIAKRINRKQNLSRKIVSLVSRWCINLFYGKGPWDVNCPYRLIKTEKFIDLFNLIPDNNLSPNLILSGYIAKKRIKFYEHPIACAPRKTGKVSLQKWTLLKVSAKSFWQTILFSFIVK